MNTAVSPFLPQTKIQFAWDSTSLGWYKTCPRLYYYSMILGYRSRSTSVHLDFGIWYHSALELYDKITFQGVGHEEALRKVVRKTLQDTFGWESDHVKNRFTLIRSIIWYLDEFAADPAQTHRLASGEPAVELSFRLPISHDLWLSGHLDRVVNYAGDAFVMDRKTTTTTPSAYYFDQYTPDNQMSLYTLAAQIVYKAPVKGVIIDAAQIAVGFTRFERGFAYRTEAMLEDWLEETKMWVAQAQSAAANPVERSFPMNDKACSMYGGCTFRRICSKDPRVRQTFLDSEFTKDNPWNPLSVR